MMQTTQDGSADRGRFYWYLSPLLLVVAATSGLAATIPLFVLPLTFTLWLKSTIAFSSATCFLVLILLTLLRKSRDRGRFSMNPDRLVKLDGFGFLLWFLFHNLFFVAIGGLAVLTLLVIFGPGPWVVVFTAGLIACMIFALCTSWSLRRAETLGLCWGAGRPEQISSFFARADAAFLLRKRYAHAVQQDLAQPRSLLREITRTLDLSRVGGADRRIDLWSSGFSLASRELRVRFKVLAVLFAATCALCLFLLLVLPRLDLPPNLQAWTKAVTTEKPTDASTQQPPPEGEQAANSDRSTADVHDPYPLADKGQDEERSTANDQRDTGKLPPTEQGNRSSFPEEQNASDTSTTSTQHEKNEGADSENRKTDKEDGRPQDKDQQEQANGSESPGGSSSSGEGANGSPDSSQKGQPSKGTGPGDAPVDKGVTASKRNGSETAGNQSPSDSGEQNSPGSKDTSEAGQAEKEQPATGQKQGPSPDKAGDPSATPSRQQGGNKSQTEKGQAGDQAAKGDKGKTGQNESGSGDQQSGKLGQPSDQQGGKGQPGNQTSKGGEKGSNQDDGQPGDKAKASQGSQAANNSGANDVGDLEDAPPSGPSTSNESKGSSLSGPASSDLPPGSGANGAGGDQFFPPAGENEMVNLELPPLKEIARETLQRRENQPPQFNRGEPLEGGANPSASPQNQAQNVVAPQPSREMAPGKTKPVQHLPNWIQVLYQQKQNP